MYMAALSFLSAADSRSLPFRCSASLFPLSQPSLAFVWLPASSSSFDMVTWCELVGAATRGQAAAATERLSDAFGPLTDSTDPEPSGLPEKRKAAHASLLEDSANSVERVGALSRPTTVWRPLGSSSEARRFPYVTVSLFAPASAYPTVMDGEQATYTLRLSQLKRCLGTGTEVAGSAPFHPCGRNQLSRARLSSAPFLAFSRCKRNNKVHQQRGLYIKD